MFTDVTEGNEGVKPEFDWSNPPPRQDPNTELSHWLDNLSPSDLVAVHVTNMFPSDQKIRSRVGLELHQPKKQIMATRDTVHFTMNAAVQTSHGDAQLVKSEWNMRKYVVLSPFQKFNVDQLKNFRPDDTYVQGDFEIPQGSTVLVDYRYLDELVRQGITTLDEIGLVGMLDDSFQGDHIFEKNGIKYIVTNFGSNSDEFRNRIYSEIGDLGFRKMEMGHNGWAPSTDSSIYKYGVNLKKTKHDGSAHINLEDIEYFRLQLYVDESLKSRCLGWSPGSNLGQLYFLGPINKDLKELLLPAVKGIINHFENVIIQKYESLIPRALEVAKNNFRISLEQLIFRLRILKMEYPEVEEDTELQQQIDEFIKEIEAKIPSYS